MTQFRTRFSPPPVLRAVAALLALALPAVVQAQSVGVQLVPSAAKVQWDDALALRDEYQMGGRVSLLFGSRVELQPFFFRSTGISVDSVRARAIQGATVVPQSFDMDHYGATAQLNLGSGDFVPFVRLGGGLLSFTSDSTPERRRITALAGGGLRFALGAVDAEIFAEQFQFRLDPARLFSRDTAVVASGERAQIQRNRAYGVSLRVPLSALPEGTASGALQGTRSPIEPFVGRLRYDGKVDLAEQDLAGVRAGIDLNSLVGIRGFAWRGINRDHDATDDIWGYGGEAQFNLNAGPGLTPYLVFGGGRLDYGPDFRDAQNRARQDQTALIVGGGASFSLSPRVRVNVAIRDWITAASDELVASRSPDDLRHNRMISAGFTWSLGGQSGRAARDVATERARDSAAREPAATRAADAEGAAVQRAGAPGDSLRTVERIDTSTTKRVSGAEQVVAAERAEVVVKRDSAARVIVIPAPTLGEVIIRYGAVAPATPATVILPGDSLRARPSAESPAAMPRTPDAPASALDSAMLQAQLDAMERRIAQRVDERVREATRADAAKNATPAERAAPREERVVVQASGGKTFLGRLAQVRPSNMSLLTGYGSGDGSQLIVGARADLGPLSAGSRFTLVPDFEVGLGGDRTTYLAVANLRYDLLTIGGVHPYVMGGAGVFSRTLLGVTTSFGVGKEFRSESGSSLYGFAELQGLNFFDRKRLLIGVASRR